MSPLIACDLQLEKDLGMSLISPATMIRDHARTALALGLVKKAQGTVPVV